MNSMRITPCAYSGVIACRAVYGAQVDEEEDAEFQAKAKAAFKKQQEKEEVRKRVRVPSV